MWKIQKIRKKTYLQRYELNKIDEKKKPNLRTTWYYYRTIIVIIEWCYSVKCYNVIKQTYVKLYKVLKIIEVIITRVSFDVFSRAVLINNSTENYQRDFSEVDLFFFSPDYCFSTENFQTSNSVNRFSPKTIIFDSFEFFQNNIW